MPEIKSCVSDDGCTALHYSAGFGSLDVSKMLVEDHSMDFKNVLDKNGRNAFLISCYNKNPDNMKYFIEKDPTVLESANKDKLNALYFSVHHGSLAGTKILVEDHS